MTKAVSKGSTTTEVVIGRAAGKLKASLDGLKQAVAEVESLATRAEDLQAIVGRERD